MHLEGYNSSVSILHKISDRLCKCLYFCCYAFMQIKEKVKKFNQVQTEIRKEHCDLYFTFVCLSEFALYVHVS